MRGRRREAVGSEKVLKKTRSLITGAIEIVISHVMT